MTTAETMARKGDLILVEQVRMNHYSTTAIVEARAAGRELPRTTTSYEFGMVHSATREGVVKTWRGVGYGDEVVSEGYPQPLHPSTRCWVLSAKSINVLGVLAEAKKHHWPKHPDSPMPFDSIDEAKAIARPYVIKTSAS